LIFIGGAQSISAFDLQMKPVLELNYVDYFETQAFDIVYANGGGSQLCRVCLLYNKHDSVYNYLFFLFQKVALPKSGNETVNRFAMQCDTIDRNLPHNDQKNKSRILNAEFDIQGKIKKYLVIVR
jgi:hypothetical protein